MTNVATRVESTGFYAGQNRLVALAVKVVVGQPRCCGRRSPPTLAPF
jgi:hypothetical protein